MFVREEYTNFVSSICQQHLSDKAGKQLSLQKVSRNARLSRHACSDTTRPSKSMSTLLPVHSRRLLLMELIPGLAEGCLTGIVATCFSLTTYHCNFCCTMENQPFQASCPAADTVVSFLVGRFLIALQLPYHTMLKSCWSP